MVVATAAATVASGGVPVLGERGERWLRGGVGEKRVYTDEMMIPHHPLCLHIGSCVAPPPPPHTIPQHTPSEDTLSNDCAVRPPAPKQASNVLLAESSPSHARQRGGRGTVSPRSGPDGRPEIAPKLDIKVRDMTWSF